MPNFSSPYLEINDVRVYYVVGSLNVDPGRGNMNVRSVTSGAGQTTTVGTRDDTTKVSRIEFSMIPTDNVFANEADWTNTSPNSAGNVIRLGDEVGQNSAGTYTAMRLTESRSFESGPDSTVSFVFMGNPVQ